MSELPEGWSLKQGDAVFSIIRGVSYDKNFARSEPEEGLVPILRANNIQNGRITTDDLVYVPSTYVSTQQHLKPGDILIATSSGSRDVVGKTAMAGPEHAAFAFGAFCAVARPRSESEAIWLFHYTRSRAYREYVETVALGININNFRTRDLAALPLPFPPLDDQHRIVAKLDSLFARSKLAREELARIPRLVERTKQSLLATAFRSNHRVALKDLTDLIQYGYTAKSSSSPIGPKYLRITDVQGDDVAWDKVPHIAVETDALERYRLKRGDIVFARSGATVGKSYLIRDHPEDAVFASYLIRVRCNTNQLDPEYAALFFQSLDYWEQIREGASGIGQPNFNGTKLGQLTIPIHPLKVQQAIILKVNNQLNALRSLLSDVARATALLDRLDQATLAKAFRGELLANGHTES